LVSRQQWFASYFQKRFASDEAKPIELEEVETATEATSEVTGQDAAASPPSNVNSTLYVGNLFFEVSEASLERLFSEYGTIKKTKIIFDHRGLSKG
jgi:nucleolin